MSDDLERQLEAFGQTLEQRTGEPITGRSSLVATGVPSRWGRRSWALVGAAACLVAVVVALATIRRDDPPSVASPATTTTTFAAGGWAPFGFDSEPIAGLVSGCAADDVLVSGEYIEVGRSYDEAVAIAERAIAEHEIPGTAPLPTGGWTETVYDTMTVRSLDRSAGIEAIVRIIEDEGVWRVAEIAQCVPRLDGAGPPTTTLALAVPLAELVPPDPLGLERDGWTLVERSTAAFESPTDLSCPAASGLDEVDGIEQVHDVVTPPDSSTLEVDVQILAVGSLERGNELATAVAAIGRCIGEAQGVEIEPMALSSIRAAWFRAGPDFALVTIVGEGDLSIVLEIENDRFTDDLIAELAHRADEFLRTGQPAARPPADSDFVPTTTIVSG